ncbi:MAG: Rv3235 family protein [Propionibacteriaceae bacterium]|nr:Rv3235 family protein [Propionibacteriaceae bacterium]
MLDPSSAQCLLVGPTQPRGWVWDPDAGASQQTSTTFDTCPSIGEIDDPALPHSRRKQESDGMTDEDNQALQIISTRYAHAVAETLDGRRGLSQLETHFTRSSLRALASRLPEFSGVRVRLASVRIQPMSGKSAEVTLRLATPTHHRAAALRVTRRGSEWMCTDLIMG